MIVRQRRQRLLMEFKLLIFKIGMVQLGLILTMKHVYDIDDNYYVYYYYPYCLLLIFIFYDFFKSGNKRLRQGIPR